MMTFGGAPRWADALFSCLASVQGGGYLYVSVSANVYVELDRKCLRQNKSKIDDDKWISWRRTEALESQKGGVCVCGGAEWAAVCVSEGKRAFSWSSNQLSHFDKVGGL